MLLLGRSDAGRSESESESPFSESFGASTMRGASAILPASGDDLDVLTLSSAGRLVREVGALAGRAGASGKRLPTLTIDTKIGFRSAADRAAFADDLTAAVLDLAARYHHDDGRPHRLVVAAHPLPEESQ